MHKKPCVRRDMHITQNHYPMRERIRYVVLYGNPDHSDQILGSKLGGKRTQQWLGQKMHAVRSKRSQTASRSLGSIALSETLFEHMMVKLVFKRIYYFTLHHGRQLFIPLFNDVISKKKIECSRVEICLHLNFTPLLFVCDESSIWNSRVKVCKSSKYFETLSFFSEMFFFSSQNRLTLSLLTYSQCQVGFMTNCFIADEWLAARFFKSLI